MPDVGVVLALALFNACGVGVECDGCGLTEMAQVTETCSGLPLKVEVDVVEAGVGTGVVVPSLAEAVPDIIVL